MFGPKNEALIYINNPKIEYIYIYIYIYIYHKFALGFVAMFSRLWFYMSQIGIGYIGFLQRVRFLSLAIFFILAGLG
jgi:hypothetical protein